MRRAGFCNKTEEQTRAGERARRQKTAIWKTGVRAVGWVGLGAEVSFMAERWNVMQTSARIPALILVGVMDSERIAAERPNPRNKRPSKFDQTLTVPTVGSAQEFNYSLM